MKKLFKDIIYTVMVVLLMAFFMTVYNMALHAGTFNGDVMISALTMYPINICIAFCCSFFIAKPISQMLVFKVFKCRKGWTINIAMTLCMVTMMVSMMCAFGTLLNAGTENFGINYLNGWWQSFVVALPLEFLIVGPLVNFLHGLMFNHKPKEKEIVIQDSIAEQQKNPVNKIMELAKSKQQDYNHKKEG